MSSPLKGRFESDSGVVTPRQHDSSLLSVAAQPRLIQTHSISTHVLVLRICGQGDVFVWIEVLSAVTTPKIKEYNTAIADAWLAITLKVSLWARLPLP